MRTSVQAPLVRSVGAESFAHITSAPVAEIEGEGVLFDGVLTDEQVGDVWWFVTSVDDVDQAERESIAADIAAAEAGTHGTSWLNTAYAKLARYAIGLQ